LAAKQSPFGLKYFLKQEIASPQKTLLATTFTDFGKAIRAEIFSVYLFPAM
jgi:hypothetical protein